MSSKFRDHVTSTAFSLNLSNRMIDCLSYFDQWGYHCGYISTVQALEDRGLIETVVSDCSLYRATISDAGEAVIKLIKIAGLYKELQPLPPAEEIKEFDIKLKETNV